jgi:uncharacterized protein YodC (DUF2158 family)
MNVGDIVFLKSGSPKLMITWLVGVTPNTNAIDVNKLLMGHPHYQVGDIAVKYINNKKEEKGTFPVNGLIDNFNNLVVAQNQSFSVGNVVKHKLSDIEMTIVWEIGTPQIGTYPLQINEMYNKQGYQNGDFVCNYFDKNNFNSIIVRATDVNKIYE